MDLDPPPPDENSCIRACLTYVLVAQKSSLIKRILLRTHPQHLGGDTCDFLSYIGLDTASTVYSQKYQEYQAYPKKIFEILATPQKYSHSVPWP